MKEKTEVEKRAEELGYKFEDNPQVWNNDQNALKGLEGHTMFNDIVSNIDTPDEIFTKDYLEQAHVKLEALRDTSGVAIKTDSNKPELLYFYFPGFVALERHEIRQGKDYSELTDEQLGKLRELELLEDYHDMILNNLDTTNSLLTGLVLLRTSLTQYYYEMSKGQKNVLSAVSNVAKLGTKKYGFLNYTKGFEYVRLVNALGRHILQNYQEGTFDVESGEPHIAHALANIYILAEHISEGKGINNLPKKFIPQPTGDK